MRKTIVKVSSVLAAITVLELATSSVFAASGYWTNDASSVWSAGTNWSSNPTVPGIAAGDIVGLNCNITAPRTVTLNVAATVGTLNIGDPISPFYSCTLSGSSTLTFNNSGSGATLAQATAGGANDTNSAPIALADNLTVTNVNGLTLSGVISGSGYGLTKTGAGTLVLSAINTFTGGAVVNAGTLTLNNGGGAACLKNNSLTINPGATVNTTIGDAIGYTSGQVTSPINIYGGTLNDAVSANEGFFTTFNLMGGTMSSTGGGAYNFNGASSALNTLATNIVSTISGPVTLRANGLTINVAQGTVPSGIDLLISGAIGGSGYGFALAGPGTLELTGTTNTYSGTTTINGGTLQIGDGVSANGAVVGNINVSSGTLVFANPTASTYPAALSGGATLIKTGAGTLTLAGANSFVGTTVVSNGILVVAATPSQSVGSTITVADGAGVGVSASADQTYLSPSSLTIGSTTGGSFQFGVYGTTQPAIAPGSLTINGTATINISSCPFVNGVSYPLLNNYSSGTLALGTQPAGVSGQLTISDSTVSYQVTNLAMQVWTAAVNTNWDSATTANWTNNRGGNLFTNGCPVQFDDSAAGSSPLLVNVTPAAVTPSFMLVSNTVKSYVIGGLAIGGGVSGLTKNGNNTLTLTGTNTFTGPISILGGQVVIGGAGQLGSGTYAGPITDNGALNYNSATNQVLSGPITGTGGLVNNGSGTLTLNNIASGYSGGTTNNSGTLTIGASSTPATAGSSVTGGPIGTGLLTLVGGTLNNNGGYTIANNIIATGSNNVQAVNGNNFTLEGSITGNGIIHQTVNGNTSQVGLGGDNSGFTGTWIQDAGNTSLRFDSASAGSANAAWVFN